jgi:hypothetical protein
MNIIYFINVLKEITLNITRAECPCGECMGKGCYVCNELGADTVSLKAIRTAFAKALNVVANIDKSDVIALAQDLENS